jgi:hypothetical protein
MSIIGVDISHYDHGIQLDTIRCWCDFVILKAYDGINMEEDEFFQEHYERSVSLGFPLIDAYMYLCCAPGHDVVTQLEDFYNIIKTKPQIKRIWVDLERRGNDGLHGFPFVPHSEIGSRAEKVCRLLKAKGTHRVGGYTSLAFIQEFMTSYPAYPTTHYWKWLLNYPVWLASYIYPTNVPHVTMDWQTFINGYLPKTNPTLSYNGVTLPMPEIRQFTGEHFELPGHAIGDNGIGQALDINIFMGTKAEFDKIANPVITPLPVELSRDEKIDRTLAKMEQVYPGIFSR